MYQMELIIPSEVAMMEFGARLAGIAESGSILYLQGPLGAGKTTLVRGFLRGLGYPGGVKSPTYTLVESYHLPSQTIHHFDLYRLANPEELEYIGLRDYLTEDAICLIEWPEKARRLLPDPLLCCRIAVVNHESRKITLTTSQKKVIELLNL
jgi:tRNA threonylcarbamoyladenosine biosynthesis protein TsaE